jgi:hypothetical protein
MPQTKPKSTTKSIRAEIIERAIRTTHGEFEHALVAEWDVSADCATIRNAARVQRHQCRKCGKPVAGIGEICVCKTKIDQVRCVLNPRDKFRELFQQRCRGIMTSISLRKFVETVTSIAIANDRDLNWVEDQIRGLLPTLKRACRQWIIDICQLPFMDTGLLPGWLREKREIIPDSELQQSLSVEDTNAELSKIEAEIEQRFEEAVKAALGHANLQMAQVGHLDLKHVATRQPRPDLTVAMIATIKRDYGCVSIEKVCQILDKKQCPLRAIDKRAGFSSWHGAWQDRLTRNRIKRFISAIPPAAGQKKV